MSKKHRIYKNTEDEFHKQKVQSLGEFYAPKMFPRRAKPNNLNMCVYVKEPFTMVGILWWLHSIGYDVQLNMANLYRPCELNHFLVLASGYANVCCVEDNHRDETDEEILEDIKHWVSVVKDNDYYKDMISCGFDIDLFRIFARWNENDCTTQVFVKNYDDSKTRFLRWHLDSRWRNYETDYPEEYKKLMRPATIQEVLDYFNGVGEWVLDEL